ncbi:hypothetical protein [Rhizobium leguminosarum]|uniref:hypothetical protein n=1 Tax=Rhizobium leguminosarum TaxID=384 RepID=UPI003F980088
MRINLSKHQRYAALAAAAITIVVLYLQIEHEGFRGYGWVLALLAAVALVIVGIGPVDSTVAPGKPVYVSPTKEELEAGHQKLRERAEVLAIEVEERAKIIEKDLAKAQPQGIRLQNPDGTPWTLQPGLESFIRERALLTSLGLVGIRKTGDRGVWITGIEYKTTEKKIFDVLARETISGMTASGLPVDKDKLLPQLLGELQTIRKCIVRAAEARKRGDSDVTGPLVAWLGGHGLKISNEAIIQTALQEGNA